MCSQFFDLAVLWEYEGCKVQNSQDLFNLSGLVADVFLDTICFTFIRFVGLDGLIVERSCDFERLEGAIFG